MRVRSTPLRRSPTPRLVASTKQVSVLYSRSTISSVGSESWKYEKWKLYHYNYEIIFCSNRTLSCSSTINTWIQAVYLPKQSTTGLRFTEKKANISKGVRYCSTSWLILLSFIFHPLHFFHNWNDYLKRITKERRLKGIIINRYTPRRFILVRWLGILYEDYWRVHSIRSTYYQR